MYKYEGILGEPNKSTATAIVKAILIASLKHHSNVNVCKYLHIDTCSIEGILGGNIIPEEPNEVTVKLFVISFIYLRGHSQEEPRFYVKVFQEDIVLKNPMKCEF